MINRFLSSCIHWRASSTKKFPGCKAKPVMRFASFSTFHFFLSCALTHWTPENWICPREDKSPEAASSQFQSRATRDIASWRKAIRRGPFLFLSFSFFLPIPRNVGLTSLPPPNANRNQKNMKGKSTISPPTSQLSKRPKEVWMNFFLANWKKEVL